MKAQFVFENLRFERGEDPMDTMQIGDIKGRKLKKQKNIPRLERDEEGLMLDFQAAKNYLIDKYSDNWDIQQLGPMDYSTEIILRPKINGKIQYGLTNWVIRDFGKKGQFITYEYNQPSQSTGKAIYSNNPKRTDYDPYITWEDLAKKWEEIWEDIINSNIKLPKHNPWHL